MTGIRCPFCNAQGFDFLKIDVTASFQVVSCSQCGAIHGILPLPIPPLAQSQAPPVYSDDLTVTDFEDVISRLIGQGHITLTPEQITQMFVVTESQTGSPTCTQHKKALVKLIVPDAFARAGKAIWICRQYQACGQWQLEAPTRISRRSLPKPGAIPPETKSLRPQTTVVKPVQKSKDRVGAMLNVKGGYANLAFDPPLCSKCKIEMIEEKVPEGHKEVGQSFWKCPNFQTCKQWLPIRE